jgi:MFS family permease
MWRGIKNYFPDVGRDVWILALGWFVSAMGFAASMPFVSIYFSQTYDMSIGTIGLYFGALAVVRAGFQLIGGEFSDRLQRKSLLVHVQLWRALSFLGMAAVVYWKLDLLTVSVMLIINSVLGSIFQPVANAMVSDFLESKARMEGYALTRSAGNLGWAAGPALGGFLASDSFGMLFVISAMLAFISGLVFLFFLRAPKQQTTTDKFTWRDLLAIKDDALLARHCVLTLLLYLVVAQLIVPFSVYTVQMNGLPEYQLGYLYAINGLMVVLLQIPITRLMSGARLTQQIALGACFYAFGYAMVGWVGGFLNLTITLVIITIGENLISPPSLTLTSRLAKEGKMGRYMGIYGFFQTAGWSFGPLYGGTILEKYQYDPKLAWGLIASLAAVSALGYYLFANRLSKNVNTQQAT